MTVVVPGGAAASGADAGAVGEPAEAGELAPAATRGPPAGANGSLLYDGNVKSNRYSGASLLNLTFADICAGSCALETRASRYRPPRHTSGNAASSFVVRVAVSNCSFVTTR